MLPQWSSAVTSHKSHQSPSHRSHPQHLVDTVYLGCKFHATSSPSQGQQTGGASERSLDQHRSHCEGDGGIGVPARVKRRLTSADWLPLFTSCKHGGGGSVKHDKMCLSSGDLLPADESIPFHSHSSPQAIKPGHSLEYIATRAQRKARAYCTGGSSFTHNTQHTVYCTE